VSGVSIIWVGHASVLIEVDGFRILTDPALTSRLAHLRRRTPVYDVGSVDVVLVSHVHMDHLHLPSLRSVANGRRLIVPAGAARLVRSAHPAIIDEVRAGERLVLRLATDVVPAITADVVHANHPSGRGPHSRVTASPVGYVISVGERTVYFAGDTDLFDDMKELGRVDVALLPIWGWGASLGERHLNPATAATATSWIRPRCVIPIHWGTYSPVRAKPGPPAWIDDAVASFRRELAEIGMERSLVHLPPGGGVALDVSGDVVRRC
jgi:L-ascorbate metabolism protein UlaG (beta-lactamase superfamily)